MEIQGHRECRSPSEVIGEQSAVSDRAREVLCFKIKPLCKQSLLGVNGPASQVLTYCPRRQAGAGADPAPRQGRALGTRLSSVGVGG